MILSKLSNYWKTKPLICRTVLAVVFWIVAILIFLKIGIVEHTVTINDFHNDTVLLDENNCFVERSWMVQAHHMHGVKYFYNPCEQMDLDSNHYYLQIYNGENIIYQGYAGSVQGGEILFSFNNINIIMGNSYRFVLSLVDSSNSQCKLFINSNYLGEIEYQDKLDTPVHIDVIDYKASTIGWFAVIILVFYSIALILSYITKKPFGQTIALSVGCVLAILFLFGVCGYLLIGLFFILSISVLISIILTVLWVRDLFDIKSICSFGFVLFSIIAMFLLFYDRNSACFRSRYDEYSLWGKSVKDMFCFDSLAVHENSAVIGFYKYVPAMQLLEYFFVRVFGLFTDGKLFFAYHFVFAAFGVATVDRSHEKINKCNKLGYVIELLIIVLLSVFFVDYAVSTIYVDAILGIIGMYTVVTGYYAERTVDWICLATGMMSLCLTKEMGVFIAFFAMIIIGTIRLIKAEKQHKIRDSKIINVMVCAASGVVWFGVYYLYCLINYSRILIQKNPNIVSNESSVHAYANMNIFDKIIAIITGNGLEYQYETIDTYLREIMTGKTSESTALLLILLVIIALALYAKQKGIGTNVCSLAYVSVGAVLCYSVIILALFMTVFPPEQAVILHSFNRYMGSALIAFIIPIILIWLKPIVDQKMNDVAVITLIIVICITPLTEVFFRASTDEMYINGRHNHYENTSSAIFSVLKPDDKIIYFDTGYADIGYQEFTDALIPICPVGRIADFDDFSNEEAIAYFKETGASYAYVTWMSDKYAPRYKTMFKNDEILNNTLYKVSYTGDNLELVPILRMGDNLTYGWYY